MFSERNFPRNCDPKNNAVLYLDKEDWSPAGDEPYGFIGWPGFATVGRWKDKLPAGNYKLIIVNQAY